MTTYLVRQLTGVAFCVGTAVEVGSMKTNDLLKSCFEAAVTQLYIYTSKHHSIQLSTYIEQVFGAGRHTSQYDTNHMVYTWGMKYFVLGHLNFTFNTKE